MDWRPGIKHGRGTKRGLRIRFETKYNKTRSVMATEIRISRKRPWVLLLRVKILLRTQSVQLRVRTSTGLEKVRVEIYLKTISYSTSLTLEGMEKLLWGRKETFSA